MTTIREKSTAALAEALWDPDDEHVHDGCIAWSDATDKERSEVIEQAEAIVNGSPTVARRLDLATAWDEAVAALPEGSWLSLDFDAAGCKASAYPPSMVAMVKAGRGPTPTDALVALTEKLREAQR